MEYLLEVQWVDPTATRVARVLTALPAEVERSTGDWPDGTSRAFCVVRARDRQSLDTVIHAITESGAEARVITGVDPESMRI